MTALPSPEHAWALPTGPTIALAPPPDTTPPQTWIRFTRIVAVTAGAALLIGMALSYASAYRAAMTAGYDNPWINHGGWQLRPAHLFPLTLDAPALVGYAGTLALAGRRSAAWARLVLWTSGAATIALQVMDGAGWIGEHVAVKAIIHGWPPAVGLLTAHLLVKILQALGILVPPVTEIEGPSAFARAWLWLVQLIADIRSTRPRLDRWDMDRDKKADIGPPKALDTGVDDSPDTRSDISGPRTVDTAVDTVADNPQVGPHVVPLTGKRGRAVAAYLGGEITQAQAAKRAGVSAKTIARDAAVFRDARTGAAGS